MKAVHTLPLISVLMLAPLAQATSITAWVIDGAAERPFFNQAEDTFNERYAEQGISVDIVPIPGYNDAIQSAYRSNDLPDIIMVDGPNMASMVWGGQLQPLDDLVDNSILDDMLRPIIDQGTYGPDGKIYALGPYDSSVVLWGNRAYLEAAGVRIPESIDDAWTYDEFEEALAALAEVDGVRWPLDLKRNYDGEWFSYGFAPFLQSVGSDLIDRDTWTADGTLNSEASVESLERLQSWAQNGWIVPSSAGDNSFFGSKTSALSWVGNWMWPSHREGLGDDLVVIPAPKFGDRAASPNGGWAWAVPSSSTENEALSLFLNHVLSTEQVAKYGEYTGYVPSRHSSLELVPAFAPGGELEIMTQQASDIAVVRPVHPAYPVISNSYGQAIQRILDGANVQQALDRAARRIDEDIEDNMGYPPFN
ncbi:sugar ABC transporter substrate-binding protein [Natronospirillum operosum]|uniref:Sugar ABC transporter substrate-binding protein n=1 Tax=Natronospirillum operosum TaxID=2759953 RepID=A0A4Z0W9T7_9GAMM|nr:sugar ABC transporter substrate-binding protein [Natronospirillum operosum]TGG92903.1 sugar ABC transporter substrate-binding protein [Natronospirillum operosum]